MVLIVRKLIIAFVLPLVILALWQYPLLLAVLKPTAIQYGIPLPVAFRVAEPKKHENVLTYPRLGIVAPIQESAATSPLNTSDWEKIRVALRQGVSVAYTQASFDDSSLVFVTGHSSDSYPHGYASIFSSLGQAHTGDQFTLTFKEKSYTYKVIDKRIMNPNDLAGFQALTPPPLAPQRVVLVTCWPLLTTQNRLVVVSERQ